MKTSGYQWYARTFEDWISVFRSAFLQLAHLKEVLNGNKQPVSIIFQLAKKERQ